jgi:hypothetical protein
MAGPTAPHKENEIRAARRLPAPADLSGQLTRPEALHTQHASAARMVLGSGTDYLFHLKPSSRTISEGP